MLYDPSCPPVVVYADSPSGPNGYEQIPVGTASFERRDLLRLVIDNLAIVCRRSSGVLRVKSLPMCSSSKYVVSIEVGSSETAAQFVTGIGASSNSDFVIQILGDIPFDGDLLVSVVTSDSYSLH